MPITFTGLASDACEELLRLAGPDAAVQMLPAAAVLQSTKAQLGGLVVWLYRAPWAMPMAAPDACAPATFDTVMAQWLATHRALLRKRRTLGKQLLLVNVEQVPVQSLLAKLGLASVASEQAAKWGGFAAVTTFLSQAFASATPESWDVFEALEALAWQPEPQELADAPLPGPEEGMRLFQLLLDAQALPMVRAAQAQAEQREQSQATQVAAATAQAQASQAQVEQLRAELQQREERLAATLAEAQQARDQATRANAACEEQLAAQRAELEKARQNGTALESQLVAQRTDAQRQGQRLAEVSAELEQARQNGTTLESQLAAQRTDAQRQAEQLGLQAQERSEALARLRQELDAERQHWNDGLAAKDAALADVRHALLQEQARASGLAQENAQVWEQLHLVQEELERHFLEGRRLQDALSQSRHTLERARRLFSRLALAQEAGAVQQPLDAAQDEPVAELA